LADLDEFHPVQSVEFGELNSPPFWRNAQDFIGVAFSYNDSDEIENPVVGFLLPRQPSKCVSVALNLEPMEAAVHHREINAAESVT